MDANKFLFFLSELCCERKMLERISFIIEVNVLHGANERQNAVWKQEKRRSSSG